MISTRLLNNILELEFTMKSQENPDLLNFHSESLLNKFGIIRGQIEIQHLSKLEGTFFREDIFPKLTPGMKFSIIACTGVLITSIIFLTFLHRSGVIKYDLASLAQRDAMSEPQSRKSLIENFRFGIGSLDSLLNMKWKDRKKAYAVN